MGGDEEGSFKADIRASTAPKAPAGGTTTLTTPLTSLPIPPSLAFPTCPTPLPIVATEGSTPAAYSTTTYSSSFWTCSTTPTLRTSPPSLRGTVTPPLAPSSTPDPRERDQHLVETCYRRRLRRYDSEVAAISEREYHRLVFREQNVVSGTGSHAAPTAHAWRAIISRGKFLFSYIPAPF